MLKSWHCVLILIIAFVAGALYPAPVTFVRGKIGV